MVEPSGEFQVTKKRGWRDSCGHLWWAEMGERGRESKKCGARRAEIRLRNTRKVCFLPLSLVSLSRLTFRDLNDGKGVVINVFSLLKKNYF